MNRFVGAYGRGVSVLVTGDDTLPLSKAMASYQHRDYDAARGNTLVCILALNDDCMRFAKSRSDLKEGPMVTSEWEALNVSSSAAPE